MNGIQHIIFSTRWRYKLALAFTLYHSCGVAILAIAPNIKLWALERPLIVIYLSLMVIAPRLLQIIIDIFPNVLFSTLIWAMMGFTLGFAGDMVLKMLGAKPRA